MMVVGGSITEKFLRMVTIKKHDLYCVTKDDGLVKIALKCPEGIGFLRNS